MNVWRRTLAALALLALAAGVAVPAFADSKVDVDIDVTIQANLSVEVDAAASSTYTANWNAAVLNAKLVSASTTTVLNDTGGLTERWALSTNAQTINVGGGSDVWTLSTSTANVGADQIAVQAVFGSSGTTTCPTSSAGDWSQSYAPGLTAAPVQYTSTLFSDPNLNSNGTPYPDRTTGSADGRVLAGSRRALCWRLVMPAATSTVQTQEIQITVTAVAP